MHESEDITGHSSAHTLCYLWTHSIDHFSIQPRSLVKVENSTNVRLHAFINHAQQDTCAVFSWRLFGSILEPKHVARKNVYKYLVCCV